MAGEARRFVGYAGYALLMADILTAYFLFVETPWQPELSSSERHFAALGVMFLASIGAAGVAYGTGNSAKV